MDTYLATELSYINGFNAGLNKSIIILNEYINNEVEITPSILEEIKDKILKEMEKK